MKNIRDRLPVYIWFISDQVVAGTWVDCKRYIKHHMREDGNLSKALSFSFGMLGVLVYVTIWTVPLYSLQETCYKRSLNVALAEWCSWHDE